MAVESGNEQMVIVACDLGSISCQLNDLVKAKIAEAKIVNPDKVILSAIHTHTSYTLPGQSILAKKVAQLSNADSTLGAVNYLKSVLPEDMEYKPLVSNEKAQDPEVSLKFIAEKIVEAVKEAWKNRQEAYYQNAFGRAAVGMCRRVVYDDGTTKMWGDVNKANFVELEGGNDSGIELIYTFDKNKELTGVVANIACPSQVVEQRSFISSDYWGKVRVNLEKKFGRKINVLGLCSAAGDQCPRDMIRWVNPETPIDDPHIEREVYVERVADPSMFDVSGLKLVGKRISNEIINVFEELGDNYKDEALLVHETVNLSLPLRRVTIKEYEESKNAIDSFIEKNRGKKVTFEDTARLYIHSGNVDRYNVQQKINTVEPEIHFIRFGDIAIATNPFELFLDYGNQIRARSLAKQTILIQLACGQGGYLPTKKAEQGSHYSAYVSSGFVGHEGG
ncbi:MAG: hypothetical protein J6R29_02895, partial [Clostridia bacterium]|nr:hypothetical protein [Clostridia bacterium]